MALLLGLLLLFQIYWEGNWKPVNLMPPWWFSPLFFFFCLQSLHLSWLTTTNTNATPESGTSPQPYALCQAASFHQDTVVTLCFRCCDENKGLKAICRLKRLSRCAAPAATMFGKAWQPAIGTESWLIAFYPRAGSRWSRKCSCGISPQRWAPATFILQQGSTS